jgi:hypothetical protein
MTPTQLKTLSRVPEFNSGGHGVYIEQIAGSNHALEIERTKAELKYLFEQGFVRRHWHSFYRTAKGSSYLETTL